MSEKKGGGKPIFRNREEREETRVRGEKARSRGGKKEICIAAKGGRLRKKRGGDWGSQKSQQQGRKETGNSNPLDMTGRGDQTTSSKHESEKGKKKTGEGGVREEGDRGEKSQSTVFREGKEKKKGYTGGEKVRPR